MLIFTCLNFKNSMLPYLCFQTVKLVKRQKQGTGE